MADQNPVTAYQRKRLALLSFIEENTEVFDRFFQMTDDYNACVVEAKQYVRDVEPVGPLVMGPFRRAKAGVSIDYDPALVPASVLTMPGVVKKLNTDVIEQHILAGALNAKTMSKARTETTATAKVDGPKEISVKL